MPFKKGEARHENAGRKKGTPNKNTQDLMAKCQAKGIDVFEAMLDYLVYPCEPALRFQALKELAQYLYPKRKALEHSGEIGNPYMEKSIEELEALVKEKLKKK